MHRGNHRSTQAFPGSRCPTREMAPRCSLYLRKCRRIARIRWRNTGLVTILNAIRRLTIDPSSRSTRRGSSRSIGASLLQFTFSPFCSNSPTHSLRHRLFTSYNDIVCIATRCGESDSQNGDKESILRPSKRARTAAQVALRIPYVSATRWRQTTGRRALFTVRFDRHGLPSVPPGTEIHERVQQFLCIATRYMVIKTQCCGSFRG